MHTVFFRYFTNKGQETFSAQSVESAILDYRRALKAKKDNRAQKGTGFYTIDGENWFKL